MDNIKEQERLYKEYWYKIEQMLGADNVAEFVRDIIIIKEKVKILSDAKKIYKKFCEVFEYDSKESILQEMLQYAKFYKWIIDDVCQDKTIRFYLQVLNDVKSKPVKAFVLFALHRLYDFNIDETRKIIAIVTSYMLRYRIVSPSNGGGAIE